MDTTTPLAELAKCLKENQFSTKDSVLHDHSSDKWHASALPDIVVFPESTEDVVKVVKIAALHQIPIYTRASGTGHVGACVPVHGGILISMMRMNSILDISPSDGVAVVQPGVINSTCLLYTSPSPRDLSTSRMPSSA